MKLDKIIDDWLENSKNYKIKFSEETTASTSTSSSCSTISFTTTTNTDAFKEPKKQTKTERIMEFFDPPEEKKPRLALFPDKTIDDLMRVDPMMSKSMKNWTNTLKEDALVKKLYDEFKISNSSMLIKNYE